MNILRKTCDGMRGLLSGMRMTLGYFVRFDRVITQQYPENRQHLRLPPRYRGKIELVRDPETGRILCGVCRLCVRVCPNGSIEIAGERDPQAKKMRLTKYRYHFGRCTLCGLCVEACRPLALRFSQEYETAVYDKADLVEDLMRGGSNLPPAPAPSAAPAAEGSAPAASCAPAGGKAAEPAAKE